MKKILLLLIYLYLFVPCDAQNVQLFNSAQWIVYRDTNSGLPSNAITKIKIDRYGNKWMIAGAFNLVKFDDVTWTVYNYTNSGLPQEVLNNVVIDNNDNKWIATRGKGLVKFDNINWSVFTKINSCVPSDTIVDCEVDSLNNVWLATFYGLVKFDTSFNCSIYNTSNSLITDNNITNLFIDPRQRVWTMVSSLPQSTNILDGTNWQSYYYVVDSATGLNYLPFPTTSDANGNLYGSSGNGIFRYDGVNFSIPYDSSLSSYFVGTISVYAKDSFLVSAGNMLLSTNYYDGNSWSYYNFSNSPLYLLSFDFAMDLNVNLWIAGEDGLYEFNPNGILLEVDNNFISDKLMISPNPTTGTFTIKNISSSDPSATLRIFNVLGEIVYAVTLSEVEAHTVNCQLPQGIYFVRVSNEKKTFSRKLVVQ